VTLFLQISQIVLSAALILVIMFQVRGGGLGGIFGQQDTVYRTRRGIERWLFQLTIVLVVLFVVVALASLRIT
jgi:preprotein translocase subunit SecG